MEKREEKRGRETEKERTGGPEKKQAAERVEEQEEERLKELTGKIAGPLLDWFADNARRLPWRDDPRPYYVWISEIMLQQTRVEAVRGYFERFIAELPDIAALAGADDDRLMKLWEGLGYYSRARNLKRAAAVVMERYGGRLPSDPEELIKLPGIGRYTAGAIASIAFGRKAAAVDGNVLRVMMRLWGSRDDIAKETVKKRVGERLERVMPEQYAGAFNQALMELGAIVCLPNGKPLCGECPVRELCTAYRGGLQTELPVKPAKKPRRTEERTILVLETDEGILVRRRPEKGLLAGLWEYPYMPGKRTEEELRDWLGSAGLAAVRLCALGEAKHIFSHIEWHMTGYYVRLAESVAPAESPEQHGNAALAESPERYAGGDEAEVLQGCFPVTERKLREEYSMPAAFDAYRILPRRGEQSGKTQP